MTLDKKILDKAVDGKFTEVSNAVKGVLHKKLSTHADSVEFSTSVDKIQQFKTRFADINSEENNDE
jgi:hypothetical protein